MLAARLATGEARAFADLYDRYGNRLYSYLLGRTGRVDQAEDLLQTVMLRVVRYRRKLRKVRNLRAWLFTLARNEALRAYGRQDVPAESSVDPGLLPAPPGHDADQEGEALRRAVARLSPERREVISLKIWQQLTFTEIGEVTGVSPNTAASRYRYALEDLRGMLEKINE
jgi:RNA polymerase sigma-70 factor (ECF subfamily)